MLLSPLQLLDLDDGLLLRVDGKTNRISSLHPLKQRRWLDWIAHRHGVHEAFDLAMGHHDFATHWHHCDHLALPHDRVQALLFGRGMALPATLRHGDDWPR